MKYRTRCTQEQTKFIPYKELLSWWSIGLGVGVFFAGLVVFVGQARGDQSVSPDLVVASEQVVQRFSNAVGSGDIQGVAQNDFVCLLKMMEAGSVQNGVFPPASDPVYAWCWDRIEQAHTEVLESRDRALDELWPGMGKLVNYSDFKRFLIAETQTRERAPSFFVMSQIGKTAGSPAYSLESCLLYTSPSPRDS